MSSHPFLARRLRRIPAGGNGSPLVLDADGSTTRSCSPSPARPAPRRPPSSSRPSVGRLASGADYRKPIWTIATEVPLPVTLRSVPPWRSRSTGVEENTFTQGDRGRPPSRWRSAGQVDQARGRGRAAAGSGSAGLGPSREPPVSARPFPRPGGAPAHPGRVAPSPGLLRPGRLDRFSHGAAPASGTSRRWPMPFTGPRVREFGDPQ